MKIKEFYGSPAWKKQRKYRLMMDNYKCARCGGLAVDVHHKTKLTSHNVSNLDISMNLDNLESICRGCHNKETHRKSSPYKFDSDGNLIPN
ncbi:HNH endonuclease [Acholeplasma laidlawii]|uniref:HNH endonuclease n=1 Tax=Acholeplasma laidlawii TaxID=2148 RepID=UPI0021F78E7C|nr:HNH endonuclease [Acholeplasma laidlawii]